MLNAFQLHQLNLMAQGRRLAWPPHRPTGTPPKNRKGTRPLRMTVRFGRVEMALTERFSGPKGLR